jgi:hypothetical protein
VSKGSYAAVNAETMNDQLERVVDDPDVPLDLLVALAELRAAYQLEMENH